MSNHPLRYAISTTMIIVMTLTIAGTASAQTSRKIKDDNYFGCTDKEYFDKLIKYIVDEDIEAFKKGLMAGIITEECTLFKKGEAVYVVDTKIFSGLAKVRRKGNVREYWTNLEALEK